MEEELYERDKITIEEDINNLSLHRYHHHHQRVHHHHDQQQQRGALLDCDFINNNNNETSPEILDPRLKVDSKFYQQERIKLLTSEARKLILNTVAEINENTINTIGHGQHEPSSHDEPKHGSTIIAQKESSYEEPNQGPSSFNEPKIVGQGQSPYNEPKYGPSSYNEPKHGPSCYEEPNISSPDTNVVPAAEIYHQQQQQHQNFISSQDIIRVRRRRSRYPPVPMFNDTYANNNNYSHNNFISEPVPLPFNRDINFNGYVIYYYKNGLKLY